VKSRSEDSPIPRGVFPQIGNENGNILESIQATAPEWRICRLHWRLPGQGWQRNTPFQSQ